MTTPKDFDTLPTNFKLYDFKMVTVPYIQIKSDIASFGACIEDECPMNEPIQVFCQKTVDNATQTATQNLNLYLPYKGTIVARPYTTFSDKVVTTQTKIYEFVHTVNVLKDDIISFTYDGEMLTITDDSTNIVYTLSIYKPKTASYRSSSDSDTFYILAFSDNKIGGPPTTVDANKPFVYTLVNFVSTDKPPPGPKTPLSTLAIVLISGFGFILLCILIFLMYRNTKKD